MFDLQHMRHRVRRSWRVTKPFMAPNRPHPRYELRLSYKKVIKLHNSMSWTLGTVIRMRQNIR